MSDSPKAHRRKPSMVDLNVVIHPDTDESEPSPPSSPQTNGVNGHTSPRSRVRSTPSSPTPIRDAPPPPSAGPYKTGFPINGSTASPLRPSFSAPQAPGHGRNRSIPGPYSPVLPSPLSESFSVASRQPPPPSPLTFSFPSSDAQDGSQGDAVPPSPKQNRRHSRIHSRNLSVFFPRPGSIPESIIAEDGAQEVEYPADPEGVLIPSATPTTTGGINSGFTFGGRPAPSSATLPDTPNSAESRASRRGHHHKHSMSHNFFSFLDPTQRPPDSPSSATAWNPISPFPDSAGPGSTSFPQNVQRLEFESSSGAAAGTPASLPILAPPPSIPIVSSVFGLAQFVLGSALWISGQAAGSLGLTGLGYWVVFDAFAIGLARVLPVYLARNDARSRAKRPYGNGRVETLMAFAQTVYLLFAAVYICKETVEHVLLSFGEGHHSGHHHDDTAIGIDYPVTLIFFTLVTITLSALFFDSNLKLVDVTGNRIPSLASLFLPTAVHTPTNYTYDAPTSPLAIVASNPFTIFPLLTSLSILGASYFLYPIQQRTFDLLLAAAETVATFSIAYPSAVVLGTVLLQTAPPRGLPGAQMESFLRVMRELERHPHILHLPAPHIWQLTPSPLTLSRSSRSGRSASVTAASRNLGKATGGGGDCFVVTMELRVKPDTSDDDILKLTSWVCDRCSAALSGFGGSLRVRGEGESVVGGGSGDWGGEADVTVGVVRG